MLAGYIQQDDTTQPSVSSESSLTRELGTNNKGPHNRFDFPLVFFTEIEGRSEKKPPTQSNKGHTFSSSGGPKLHTAHAPKPWGGA